MILDKENPNREQIPDQFHIDLLQSKKPAIWKIFSSQEYRTLWRFLRPRRFTLIVITILSFSLAFAEGARTLTLVILIKALVASDAVFSELMHFSIMGISFNLAKLNIFSSRLGYLAALFVLLMLITMCTAGMKMAETLTSRYVQLRMVRDIRGKAIEKLFSFNSEYFTNARSGELYHLMTAETGRFLNIITSVSRLLNLSIQTLIYMCMLFYLFWDFSLIVLITALIFFIFHLILDSKLKIKGLEANKVLIFLSHCFHQIIYGIKMIKIGGLEYREQQQYLKAHKEYESHEYKMAVISSFSRVSIELVMVIILFATILFGYFFKDMNKLMINPGQLLAYLFLLARTMPVATSLQTTRSGIISMYAPLSRVIALLNTKSGPDKFRKIRDDSQLVSLMPIKHLSTRDISFSYDKRKDILHGISLDFTVGTIFGLVGLSGSGKSTFMDILSSISRVDSGVMLVDDVPVDQLMGSYKQSVGYVNQEPIIFHDTVLANVKYFKPNASDAEVWQALHLAAAENFVRELPDGLDTGLGERGLTVSGGERQRIGLARVFLQNPTILLLDEATNALDYETEKQIYNNLDKMKQDKIIIVAAHRLSAIKDFGRIIVLHQGRVIEQGTHSELLANKSFYYNLFMVQEKVMD